MVEFGLHRIRRGRLVMATYVYVYTGGSVPDTAAEQEAVMAAWGAWYGELADAIVDGGNPFGPSTTVRSDGSSAEGGASRLTGYSIVRADSLDAATKMAGGCPVLTSGGQVEVYETFDVMQPS
jgi:hypothetical protein